MSFYKNENSQAMFEFEKIDFYNGNGSESYAFKISVISYEFAASLNNIWFYKEDLLLFITNLNELACQKVNKVKLEAQSDFIVTIISIDTCGHFKAKFELMNQILENSSILTVEITTQILMDFAMELEYFMNI